MRPLLSGSKCIFLYQHPSVRFLLLFLLLLFILFFIFFIGMARAGQEWLCIWWCMLGRCARDWTTQTRGTCGECSRWCFPRRKSAHLDWAAACRRKSCPEKTTKNQKNGGPNARSNEDEKSEAWSYEGGNWWKFSRQSHVAYVPFKSKRKVRRRRRRRREKILGISLAIRLTLPFPRWLSNACTEDSRKTTRSHQKKKPTSAGLICCWHTGYGG